ncbi:hypothetical protein MNB_SUP05-SYMBIONT-5-1349 [hydrothermal vent metagenome]|uniref:Uncharacterized protein n=1 Tax=hydrothermal vent metagenome TaxID=652676 RepID=A0A1W1E151_9ZZZZ
MLYGIQAPNETPNPKVEIAKIVLSLAPSVFAKNISPTHRFGGYFL